MKFQREAVLWFLARVAVGIVFAYAGFSKLVEPVENFRGALAEYKIFPYAWVSWIAVIVPWLEFLSGAFLILGFAVRFSAFVSAFLCFGFLTALSASKILYGSFPASCGCFGQGGLHLNAWQVILLDAADLILSLKLFALREHPFSLDSRLRHPNGI